MVERKDCSSSNGSGSGFAGWDRTGRDAGTSSTCMMAKVDGEEEREPEDVVEKIFK